MSNDGVTITLVVREPWSAGGKEHVMAIGSDEFPIFSERFVDDMVRPAFPGAGGMSFDQSVSVLKERKFRRDLLERAAAMLAEKMADHLEDREGWHGERRRDRIKELGL